MGEEVKKISFGFNKLAKKTSIVSSKLSQPKIDNNKVEFIDCVEGKSIKLKDPIKCEDTVLVIPLKREPKDCNVGKDLNSIDLLAGNTVFESNPNKLPILENQQEESKLCASESVLVKKETLDEIAEREILEDLNKKQEVEENRIFSVPLTNNTPVGEAESSLDDYENIPVTQFGLAMLRGMGWAPGKGIGKNEQLVTPSLPTLRPKGMGLGADKVIKSAMESSKSIDKDLKMARGSFVRIIAGTHKDCYGQIEGFDDESGRMIVKIALKNISVSLNEFMTQLVEKNEYLKNSKVINMGKYEQYKDDEGKKELLELSKRDDNHRQIPSGSSDQSRLSSTKTKDTNFKSRPKSKISEEIYSKNYDSTHFSKHPNNRSKVGQENNRSSRTRLSYSSSSNQTSDSDSDYSDRKKHRTKKKKPSSHRHKSRTRSRSPKHHRSHKKHSKRKDY